MSEVDEPQELSREDELYNSVRHAAFVEQTEEGLLFSLEDHAELRLLVDGAEYKQRELPAPGEQVELLVERPWGAFWTASMLKAEKLAMYDILRELAQNKGTLRGTIVSANKGGLNVDVGVRGFIPWSQVDLHRVEDPSPYIGRKEEFLVTEFDEEKCQVVLSRARLLKQQQREQAEQVRARLNPGEVFEGIVRTVKPYGVFVDVGGVEGLLHVTNMSWARVDHPSELFRVGDEVRVVVIEYDAKKDRLSLGRKQMLADPWEDLASRMSEGDVISGKVVSLADFGAFVEVAPGLEGLVHVTELSWTGHVDHPSALLEIGQEIAVKVIAIDAEGRRLSLSIKQLEPNPWQVLSDRIKEGDVISGKVRNVTDFGAFVEVAPGIDGLVHISNVTWNAKTPTPAEAFTSGETIEVKVLGIDPAAERLELGIKQLGSDPWEEVLEEIKPGTKIPVVITRVADFGAFAQVREGVEGLIHISELSADRVDDVFKVVRLGQQVDALVLAIDRGARRISLSLKRDEIDEEMMSSYSEEEHATSTLGDLLRERLGLDASEEE